jgi:hypothetical protein
LPTSSKFKLLAHVGDQVAVAIDVEHLAANGCTRVHCGLEADLFLDGDDLASDDIGGSAAGEVACRGDEHALGRKGHVGVLDLHGQFERFMRLAVEQQAEDPVVRTDEVLAIVRLPPDAAFGRRPPGSRR